MKPDRTDDDAPERYPPLSVWSECDVAGRRADELSEQGLELHFAVEQDTGTLVIELRSLEDGRVLRTLPVRDAMRIADGGPIDP